MEPNQIELLWKNRIGLTRFQPMFHLWIDQVVGFYYQNVWKTPVEEWCFK